MLKIFKRLKNVEKHSKVARTLTDEVEKNKHEIINVKGIVIQIEEELKRIEEVLKNGRD